MFKNTSDLFKYIGLSLFGGAAILVMIYLLGEVHGLIVAVIILYGQLASLFVRMTALERELTSLRQERGGTAEKITGQV